MHDYATSPQIPDQTSRCVQMLLSCLGAPALATVQSMTTRCTAMHVDISANSAALLNMGPRQDSSPQEHTVTVQYQRPQQLQHTVRAEMTKCSAHQVGPHI